jgi:hypothetical protein
MYKTLFLSLSVMALLISGCSGKKPMYEYSNYSESYYQLKQTGDAESTARWKTSLEDSIEKSNVLAIRVPPGIYANLGYLYLKVNDTQKAISFFKMEKALYPESGVFMDNLIKKAELMKEGRKES